MHGDRGANRASVALRGWRPGTREAGALVRREEWRAAGIEGGCAAAMAGVALGFRM